ncbi:MAG: hypothetical protein M3O50_21655 [Myxococcota bacterium]|nr:hypothetical protein [Myxococcota bacterium]
MTRTSSASHAWVLAVLCGALSGCAGARAAAARDPMKCERDPSCAKGRASYADCTRQCVDDPECVSRCEQMQGDRLGHP